MQTVVHRFTLDSCSPAAPERPKYRQRTATTGLSRRTCTDPSTCDRHAFAVRVCRTQSHAATVCMKFLTNNCTRSHRLNYIEQMSCRWCCVTFCPQARQRALPVLASEGTVEDAVADTGTPISGVDFRLDHFQTLCFSKTIWPRPARPRFHAARP